MKNPARAFLWLLLIPLQFVLDLLLLFCGSMLDMRMANPEAYGHPAPGFVLLALAAAALFSIIVPVFAIIMTVIRYRRLKKAREKQQESGILR